MSTDGDLPADAVAWTLTDELPPTGDDDLLTDVLLEAQSYRLLAQQAIHALYDRTRQLHQLQEHHQRLLDEYRHLRAQTMQSEAA